MSDPLDQLEAAFAARERDERQRAEMAERARTEAGKQRDTDRALVHEVVTPAIEDVANRVNAQEGYRGSFVQTSEDQPGLRVEPPDREASTMVFSREGAEIVTRQKVVARMSASQGPGPTLPLQGLDAERVRQALVDFVKQVLA